MNTLLHPGGLPARTERHTELLYTLADWLNTPSIQAAMIKVDLATPGGLVAVSVGVKATLDGVPLAHGDEGMTEVEAAQSILLFMSTRPVRRAIAAHIHRTWGGQGRPGRDYGTVVRSMDELGSELVGYVREQLGPAEVVH